MPSLNPIALYSGRYRGLSFLLLGLGVNFLLAACSINPKVDLASIATSPTPIMLEVPFYAQTDYQCGPAALATVLTAAGVETTAEQLTPKIYLPERQGSLQLELLPATRRGEDLLQPVAERLSQESGCYEIVAATLSELSEQGQTDSHQAINQRCSSLVNTTSGSQVGISPQTNAQRVRKDQG